MRIIRPQQLVVIKGGYQIGQESRLGISVVAGCYLSRPEHFVTEAQIWEAWQRAPLSLKILDTAEPKPFAEYLIAGHAGIGRPVKTLNVSADIGGQLQRWRIEGEGARGSLGAESFLRMPMDHPSAWGGKNIKDNPLGRGSEDGQRPTLMTIGIDGSAQERSPLAAPTPIPHEFMARKRYIDKVAGEMASKEYLEKTFPGLPASVDRRYFQMAAPAQWLTEEEWPIYIPFELQGFSEYNRAIRGVLPAVRAVAFIHRRDKSTLENIMLQRKTLWFFPDSDIALIIYTGSVAIEHLLDESISSLMVGLDRCDMPRPDTHFQQVYQKRSDDEASPFEFLFDPDLMPESMALNAIESASDHPSSLRYEHKPPEAGTSALFYQRIHKVIAQHQQHKEEMNQLENNELPEIPYDNEYDLLYQDKADIEEKNFGPGRLNQHLIGKNFHRCHFAKCDFSQTTLENCSFQNCVFESINLSQATLRNVTIMQSTLLNAVLTGSHLQQVTLQTLSLDDVVAQGIQMENVTLDGCSFEQGTLKGSHFIDCTISNTQLNGSELSQVSFVRGQLDSCIFNRCDAGGLTAADMLLTKNSILGGNWQSTYLERCQIEVMTAGLRANFSQAQFSDCHCTKMGMKQVDLIESKLLHCTFTESNFDEANLTSSTITACDIAGGRFKDSVLVHSLWKSTSLQQGLLYNADLRGAGFEWCNFAAANLAMSWQDAETHFNHCLFERACWLPRRVIQGAYYEN